MLIGFGTRESPIVDLLLQRKVTKEKSPSLRNFLPYQAKTALPAPRRYRSCPSELPAAILNRGKCNSFNPSGRDTVTSSELSGAIAKLNLYREVFVS